MKLFSWNVNCARAAARTGQLQQCLATYQPDVLCLQEVKATAAQLQTALPTPAYHHHVYAAAKPGYAGTALLSRRPATRYRNGLPADIVQRFGLIADRYGDPNDEGRIIAADFDDFWLVTCYTPNSKGDLSRLALRHDHWDPACLAYLQGLERGRYGPAKPVLYCGDMNVAHTDIDVARPKENVGKHGFTTEERAGFQAYLDAGFVDTFRAAHPQAVDAYTWWTHWANARSRNVGWRIDYWLASQELVPRISGAAIHPEQQGSDHCPVSIEVAL